MAWKCRQNRHQQYVVWQVNEERYKTRNCPLATHFIFVVYVERAGEYAVRQQSPHYVRCNVILNSDGWMTALVFGYSHELCLMDNFYTRLQYIAAGKRRKLWQMRIEPLIFFSFEYSCKCCIHVYIHPTHAHLITRRKKRSERRAIHGMHDQREMLIEIFDGVVGGHACAHSMEYDVGFFLLSAVPVAQIC